MASILIVPILLRRITLYERRVSHRWISKQFYCSKPTIPTTVVGPETKVEPPMAPIPVKPHKFAPIVKLDSMGRETIFAYTAIRAHAFAIKIKLGLALASYAIIPLAFKSYSNGEASLAHVTFVVICPFVITAIIAAYSRLYTKLIGKIMYDSKRETLLISTVNWRGNKLDREISVSDIVGLNTASSKFGTIKIILKDKSTYVLQFNSTVTLSPTRFKEIFRWSPPTVHRK